MASRGNHKRANSEGSIYQRKSDGKWVGVITLGFDEDGNQIRKVFYGKGQQEVKDKLAKARADQMRGMPISTSDKQTVEQYLTHWLENEAKYRLKERTFERYSEIINVHLLPTLGNVPLVKLNRQMVQSLLNRKSEEKTKQGKLFSALTIHYIRAVLRKALNDAIKNDLIVRNAAALAQPPKAKKREVLPLMPDQVGSLLRVMNEDRMKAFFITALMMGLRSGELLGLTWEKVDFEQGTVKVEKTLQRIDHAFKLVPPKSETSQRLLTMPELVIHALREHRGSQLLEKMNAGGEWGNSWDLVFTTVTGNPIHRSEALQKFRRLLKRADLPQTFRLHDLRHTCATFLMVNGADGFEVMKTLGHSTIALTMNTYSHALPELRKRVAERMNSIIEGISGS